MPKFSHALCVDQNSKSSSGPQILSNSHPLPHRDDSSVSHFNWGLHDLKLIDGKQQVVPGDYEANLKTLVAKLKQTNATLIWCSTTPVPDGPLNPPRSFHDVLDYNAIAAKIMTDEGIVIDDLYAFAKPIQAEIQKPHDVHFIETGSAKLADKVAEIEKALPANRSQKSAASAATN